MVEIIITDECRAWYEGLSEEEQEPISRTVDLLEREGVQLRFPYSSSIKGSRYPLRELRTQHRGAPIRILYAFDPERQAVLLIGGMKAGRDRFYEELVPRAEVLWEEYLKAME